MQGIIVVSEALHGHLHSRLKDFAHTFWHKGQMVDVRTQIWAQMGVAPQHQISHDIGRHPGLTAKHQHLSAADTQIQVKPEAYFDACKHL